MRDLPWNIGLAVAIAFFIVFETRAFRHPERQNSLSRWIYNIGSKFPLSIWIMGVVAGSLATHFFWHWCPPGSISTGWNAAPIELVRNVAPCESRRMFPPYRAGRS